MPIRDDLGPILERIGRIVAEREPEILEAIRRDGAERRLDRARASRLPRSLVGVTFEGSDLTPALERARRFLEREAPRGRCLVMSGETGRGKTWAAAAVLNAWEGAGLFWQMGGLARLLLSGPWEERERAHAGVENASLLVLDDVGSEHLREGSAMKSIFDRIVWAREAERRATIITTNLPREQFKDEVSERVADRLRAWGSFFAVPGGSLRGKKA